ncbi:alpha/beta hydrolase [Ruminococcus albus]|uniref:alpha/beta hydrolase n=1 Tax=Ruminococcus albus TaxID=1264 RepID=UPI0039EE4FBA
MAIVQEWDKTFPKSDKVSHRKVTFHNRCGITLAADMYTPLNAEGRLPAIAMCGPFGAVNETRSAVMVMHGDKAHSFYFGKDAYENMTRDSKYADNKELPVIEGAVHTDLYDGGDRSAIPFDKPADFYNRYMGK